MSDFTLEELKQVELEAVLAFDKFTTKHGLRYQLAWGTLIGAVRHHGFIPWDDDIDLVMPKSDYFKLIDIVNARNDNGMIDERYRLAGTSVQSTIPYHQVFMKVYDTKTTVRTSELRPELGFQEGVFLDIFCVTGAFDDDERQDAYLKRLEHAFDMASYATRQPTEDELNVFKHPRWALHNRKMYKEAAKKPYKEWLAQYEMLLRALPEVEGAKRAYSPSVVFMDGPTFKYDCNPWMPSIRIPFEGHDLPVPEDYDTVLRGYGDYMQLPPEDKQIPSHNQGFHYR